MHRLKRKTKKIILIEYPWLVFISMSSRTQLHINTVKMLLMYYSGWENVSVFPSWRVGGVGGGRCFSVDWEIWGWDELIGCSVGTQDCLGATDFNNSLFMKICPTFVEVLWLKRPRCCLKIANMVASIYVCCHVFVLPKKNQTKKTYL